MKRLLFISALLLSLLSCQREQEQGVYGSENNLQPRSISLLLNLDPGRTKAQIGNTVEDKVTNLAVIALPSKSSVSASWEKALVTEIDSPQITDGIFSGEANAYIGNNTFYVLVNYPPEMISFVKSQAVANGKGLRVNRQSAFSPSLPSGSFGQRQEELMSYFKDSDRGIAMMAKCIDGGGNSEILIAPNTTSVTLDGELHRMIAKVKMSFQTYPHATDYVVVEGFTDKHQSEIPHGALINGINKNNGSQAGWVPLNSIRYCLNAVNTKVFLEASDNCDNLSVYPEDPNFYLDDTIVPDGSDWSYAAGYESDFLFWDPNDAATLFNENPGTASWIQTPSNDIYCLENMVFSDEFLSGFELSSSYRRIAPRKATTHLLVESQFTPRYIITGRQPAGLRDPIYQGFHNQADAIAILKDNDHLSEPGDGTFWTPDLKHFYNWNGVLAEIEYSREQHDADPSYRRLTIEDFVKYPQGKCYYTAYISGTTATDPDTEREFLTYADGLSSVRRDAGYTLNATVLHVPSISTFMIEINTTCSLEWPERDGSGEINIMPQ